MLKTQHSSELSDLENRLAEKQSDLISQLETEHASQLNSARSQLTISKSLEMDYMQIKADVDRLKLEKDINSQILRQVEAERDALLKQATGKDRLDYK